MDWTEGAACDDDRQSQQLSATDVTPPSLPGRVSPERAMAALQEINPNDNDNNCDRALYKRRVQLLLRLCTHH